MHQKTLKIKVKVNHQQSKVRPYQDTDLQGANLVNPGQMLHELSSGQQFPTSDRWTVRQTQPTTIPLWL